MLIGHERDEHKDRQTLAAGDEGYATRVTYLPRVSLVVCDHPDSRAHHEIEGATHSAPDPDHTDWWSEGIVKGYVEGITVEVGSKAEAHLLS